jgi:coenzyme Q-binding protein COQ10
VPSYQVQHELAHSAEQLFDLAADVERYPDFLPLWIAARVRRREADAYCTDQLVGIGPVRARFQSRTLLQRPERIEVTSTDRLFRHFHLIWRFEPLSDDRCRVTLAAELELRSKTIRELFGRAVNNAFGSILTAFEAQARRVYGASEESAREAGNDLSSDSTE